MIKKIRIRLMRIITIYKLPRSLMILILKSVPRKKIQVVNNGDIVFNSNDIYKEIKNSGFSSYISMGDQRLKSIIDYSDSIEFSDLNENKFFKIKYDSPKNPSPDNLWYTNGKVIECNDIRDIVYDDKCINIARKYLGVEPTIKDVRMWWSFPPSDKNYNPIYGFHYDIDSFKFLKLFFYITDVDENSGPHVIISDTHKSKSSFERKNRRLTDEKVAEIFDEKRINVMTGNKGSGFFEDTFCYHKGTTPHKPRLILQVEYSI